MIVKNIIKFFKDKKEEKKQKHLQELEYCFNKVKEEWAQRNENTKEEYNYFFYSTDNLIGQPISVIKAANSTKLILEKRSINIPSKGICPTCGGKVVGGKCQYCGNEYDDNTEIVELTYECKYGEKTYIFKNGLLTTINTDAIPIEHFLIKFNEKA